MPLYKFILFITIMFTNSDLFSYDEGMASNNDIEIYYRDYGPQMVIQFYWFKDWAGNQ